MAMSADTGHFCVGISLGLWEEREQNYLWKCVEGDRKK